MNEARWRGCLLKVQRGFLKVRTKGLSFDVYRSGLSRGRKDKDEYQLMSNVNEVEGDSAH